MECRFYDGSKGSVKFVQGRVNGHRGQDLQGTPRTKNKYDIEVLAPYKCIIEHAGDGSFYSNGWSWGLMVRAKILEGPLTGYYFIAAHFNSLLVSSNQTINAGTPIGYEGWTGNTVPVGSGGKHLHVELLEGWTTVDCAPLTGFPDNTISKHYTNSYRPNGGSSPPPPTDPVKPPPVNPTDPKVDPLQGQYDAAMSAKNAAYDRYISLVKEEKRLRDEVLPAANANKEARWKEREAARVGFEKVLSKVPALEQTAQSKLTSLSNDVTSAFTQLTATLNAKVTLLQNTLQTKFDAFVTAMNSLLTTSKEKLNILVAEAEQYAVEIVTVLHNRLNFTYNILTGFKTTFENTIYGVFELHREDAIESKQFDSLALTSQGYDSKAMNAFTYDTQAKKKL